MKRPRHRHPRHPRPGDDALDLEEAFELLLAGQGPGVAERVVSDLRAEAIARYRCTYCGQPAQVSRFELDGQQRTLLCGVCRSPRG